MPIIILGKKDAVPAGYVGIDCTSASPNAYWKQFSPFYLGPVETYDGLIARRVENAYQYAKVYTTHITNGEPNARYFEWRDRGFASEKANRYPMGSYGITPEYSLWKEDGQFIKLGYTEARKKIYLPLYSRAVKKTLAFAKLQEMHKNGENIALIDFDGYNHKLSGMSYEDVVNNTSKPLGHAFVIAMLVDDDMTDELRRCCNS